jgi:hypothetical protein
VNRIYFAIKNAASELYQAVAEKGKGSGAKAVRSASRTLRPGGF